MDAKTIGAWTPAELQRFVANTVLTQPDISSVSPSQALPRQAARGDVPVWDGSRWVPSSSQPVDGMALNWHIGANPPPEPKKNMLWVYNGQAGLYWSLLYDPTETTYPWKFIGGPPLTTFSNNDISTASGAWFADPILTLPRAGDYDLSFYNTGGATPNASTQNIQWYVYLGDGSSTFGYPWLSLYYWAQTTLSNHAHYVTWGCSPALKTGLAAGTTLKQFNSVAAWDFESLSRSIAATPARIA